MVDWAELLAIYRLGSGKTIIHATEGVFGLACDALSSDACQRLSYLKSRTPNKQFIVVVADFRQIERFVGISSAEYDKLTERWSVLETWVMPASKHTPAWLRGRSNSLAVRVTRHEQFSNLCRHFGPIVSTSANPAKRRPALNLLRARQYFGNQVDYYLSGALIVPGKVSVIRDIRTGKLIRS
jgi:L-threonylcarbamoyladenylate synthase